MEVNGAQAADLRSVSPRSAAERAAAAPGGRTSIAEPTLLCALALRPGHGYDLKRTVEELTEGLVSLDLPGVYRMLRRLEGEGLVESHWAAGEAGPQRREYALTSAGWHLLLDWREFMMRQRHVCQLTTDAIDAAVIAAAISNGADRGTTGSPVTGGEA